MIIEPVSAPAPITQTQKTTNNFSARDKAIAALLGASPEQTNTGNAQATQVPNPSKVAVEDVTALKTPQTAKSVEQVDTSEPELAATPENKTTSEEETTEEAPLSSQYAVLARKEKALRAKAFQQEQAFKQREAALTAREAELNAKSNPPDFSNYVSKDQLKRNAYATLAELGVTYDDISQQALAAQSPDYQSIQSMREEISEQIKQLREEQANTKKALEQQTSTAYQQAVNQIKTEAKKLIYTDPEFETIKATNSVNDVVELIERTFKDDGVLLTVEDAAREVENYLVDEAIKLAKTKKISSRLQPNVKPQSVPQPQTNTTTQQINSKTLTNAMGAARPLSAKERAMLAFKGELQKG